LTKPSLFVGQDCHHEPKSALIEDNVGVSKAPLIFQVVKDIEAQTIKLIASSQSKFPPRIFMLMAEDKGDHLKCQQFVYTNKGTINLPNNQLLLYHHSIV